MVPIFLQRSLEKYIHLPKKELKDTDGGLLQRIHFIILISYMICIISC